MNEIIFGLTVSLLLSAVILCLVSLSYRVSKANTQKIVDAIKSRGPMVYKSRRISDGERSIQERTGIEMLNCPYCGTHYGELNVK